MDKFNKQYSPEELEEMKQDFASHQKLTEWRRKAKRVPTRKVKTTEPR